MAWWEVLWDWQGACLQVQHAKYHFSSVFSPSEISAWILLQNYQVAAFILAETLHCRQNQLFCALFWCRLELSAAEEADDSGLSLHRCHWCWRSGQPLLLPRALIENDFCCVQVEPVSMGHRYMMPRGRARSHWPPLSFVSTYCIQALYIFKGMKRWKSQWVG